MKQFAYKFGFNFLGKKNLQNNLIKLQKILLGTITLKYLTKDIQNVKLEDQTNKEDQQLFINEFQGQAHDYVLNLQKDLQLYKIQIYPITLPTGQTYDFIFIKLDDNKVIAFLDNCPLDNHSQLKNGILLRNKIICPNHGCEYNIEDGQVEKFPSFRNLVVYPVNYDKEKKQLQITLPDQIPLYQHQNLSRRSPEDHRKIIILGSGPAGISTALALRQFQYTGNIFVFTNETNPPTQKQNLTKYLNYEENKNNLELMSTQNLQNLGINMMYGTSIEKIDNDSMSISFVEKDKIKYVYDALVIAIGSKKPTAFQSDNIAQNFIHLNNIFDFKKSSKQIDKAKDIIIVGLTEQSLELASTIKQQDKTKNIKLIGFGINQMQKIYQKEFVQKLIEKFQKEGIEFISTKKLKDISLKKNNKNFITKITLNNNDKDFIPVDLIYKFQTKEKGFDFLKNYKEFFFLSGLDLKINVDSTLKTFHNNIFSVGQAARVMDPTTGQRVEQTTYTDAQEQGRMAALNILGQKYNYRNISFGYYNYFGQSFQKIGQLKNSDNNFQIGDVQNLEFINIYARNNIVSGCVSSGLKYNKVGLLIREALKQRRRLFLSDFKKDHNSYIQNLYLQLLQDPMSGTHFQSFYKRRFSPEKDKVLFKSQDYYKLSQMDDFANMDELQKKFKKRLS